MAVREIPQFTTVIAQLTHDLHFTGQAAAILRQKKTMKRIILLLIAVILCSPLISTAQDSRTDNTTGIAKLESVSRQFMQITTIESVIAGGLGRSRMIITGPDGSQKESDMENLFSIAGINFKNIKENEDRIVRTLKNYTDDGWKVDHVTSLTLSQNDSGSGGIFMTRYLLSRPLDKKGF